MAKYSSEETGHADAAADVRADTDDRACRSQEAALSPWGRSWKTRDTGEGDKSEDLATRSAWSSVLFDYS